MILWTEAITNRSQNDLTELKNLLTIPFEDRTDEQKQKLNSDMKGAFNVSDMERLESNIQLLSDVLELNLTTYYGNLPQYPTKEYFERLINNVETIRSAYTIHINTPSTPTLPVNTFKKLNDIETILDDVYKILMSNFESYCATNTEIYIGEQGILL